MYQGEELAGGRRGKIFRKDERVIRPVHEWTATIHQFLAFLNHEGANFAPIPYEINDEWEEISFIPGKVYNGQLPKIFDQDSMIISAALLLLKYHEISKNFIPQLTGQEKWMLINHTPHEVICHGDFAPYNVVIHDEKAAAIIDFDTAHPGSRMWDVTYAVYRWVPLVNSENLSENIRKAKLFLDTYGVDKEGRQQFVLLLIQRLESLVNYMRSEARNGNEDFQKHIESGHVEQYLGDIQYLNKNEKEIINGIT